MGLIDKMKQDIAKSGGNRGKLIYVRPDSKVRVRFLTDMDDGFEVTFHDSYAKGVNVPCQEQYGRSCPYCDDEDLRTRSMYVWSVWDYEAKEVKLFMFAVNNCSPIPQLMAFYENYGTITDRDYVIGKTGKGTSTAYNVIPQDKNKFRNAKAKPYTERQVLKMLDKAYPATDLEYDDSEDEDEKPTTKRAAKQKESKPKKQEESWESDDSEDMDYDSMSPRELFSLCKEREIDVVARKPKRYYINLLEEWDAAQDDWSDEDGDWSDDEDDWEDE